MKLILLGAPGAGKGTQAKILTEKLNIPAISTGAIIREAIEAKTPFGIEAKAYIDKGELLPDELMIPVIEERLKEDDCKNGYILDGFPRTINQAKFMDKEGGDWLDMALSLEVEDEVIVDRLSGRRECSKCRAPYHIRTNPPKKAGICDLCGGEIIAREDDKAEIIKSRLDIYHKKTAPLKDYFREKGILKEIVSQSNIEDTSEKILKAIESLG